jgi:hypothetical protein
VQEDVWRAAPGPEKKFLQGLGSGAVWHPQLLLLVVALYLGGSIGTRFIPTVMVTKGSLASLKCSPPDDITANFGKGSLGEATSKCPIEESASAIVDAKSFSSFGARTWTPVSKPPTGITVAILSATGTRAACNTAIICDAKPDASASVLYDTTEAAWPWNLRHASAIRRCWSRLRLLGAIMASSLRFSDFSPSESLRNCAASFSAVAARSYAPPARCFASSVWYCLRV